MADRSRCIVDVRPVGLMPGLVLAARRPCGGRWEAH